MAAAADEAGHHAPAGGGVAAAIKKYRVARSEPAYARFRLDAAADLAEALIREIDAKPHAYLSTACLHGLHARCRLTCKFCGVMCSCGCGHTVDVLE